MLKLKILFFSILISLGIWAKNENPIPTDTVAVSILTDSTFYHTLQMLENYQFTEMDSLVYRYSNPFFFNLIFPQKEINIPFEKYTFSELYFGKKRQILNPFFLNYNKNIEFSDTTDMQILTKIRKGAYTYLANNHATIFSVNSWELPDIEPFKYRLFFLNNLYRIKVSDKALQNLRARQIEKIPVKLMNWQPSFSALVQFSQNYISANWYQGGTSNMSILSVMKGGLIYMNFKNIKWETTAEWRTGFMSVAIDSARQYITNDDIIKIDSKFDLKAKGNWSYSALLNVSTQFFDNYQSFDSHELKSRFLTPVRLNFGFGMNYSYTNILSVMFAPVSYKLIYLPDTVNVMSKKYVNPNLFGIETGKNKLSEIGSSLTAQLKWKPLDELSINSTFKFYTNYKKIEIDWETIADFTINRFLSTRVLLNPRYDNTVIMPYSQKAKIQFKELLSFGFSYKFR